jgi:hypothetical protein
VISVIKYENYTVNEITNFKENAYCYDCEHSSSYGFVVGLLGLS